MSHDIVADALNMISNANRARKKTVKINRISNLLIEILKIMRAKGAIKKYKIDSKAKSVDVTIENISACKSIKPRFSVNKDNLERYRRRYLPSRNLGTMIISSPQGLVSHSEAVEKNVGGCLIAFFY